jgi:glycosyltransferase involved in cell wall biosynthesis
MKVLVTGIYKQSYNRILILISGLRKNGAEVVEFRYDKRNTSAANEISRLSSGFDVVFLPSFTHADVPFVRKHSGKPIVFDPLVSRYLTKVFDRQTVWKFSPRAYKNFLKDKRAFSKSDLVIADTLSHKEYYCKTFRTDPEKIEVIPVGVDTDLFFPVHQKKEGDQITAGFYGTFIPLHGINRILEAADLLKDHHNIRFEIIGTGPLFRKITTKNPPDNINFRGWVSYNDLNGLINNMDICLGIFGESLKADLVIPNKIFHYAACGKPIITKDTRGIREIFVNNSNIILTSNKPADLASAILDLAGDSQRRKQIGTNAYELVKNNYTDEKIGKDLLRVFEKAIAQG